MEKPPPYEQSNPVYPNLNQQQYYPPAAPLVNPTIAMSAPGNYGPQPQNTICPSCHANIKTTTEAKATTRTHITALLLCLFLCWPCVCVPYCMDSCQNIDHYCPNCRAYLGSYSH